MSDEVMERIEEVMGNKPAGRVFSLLTELTLIRFLGPETFSLVHVKNSNASLVQYLPDLIFSFPQWRNYLPDL
jgi:hypothetical protein